MEVLHGPTSCTLHRHERLLALERSSASSAALQSPVVSGRPRRQCKGTKRAQCSSWSSCSKALSIGSRNGDETGVQFPVGKFCQAVPRRMPSAIVSVTAKPMEEGSLDSVPGDTKSGLETIVAWLHALYLFSRPHTVIGSAVGVISVSLLAVQTPADFSMTFFLGLLQALIPALFMNIYIVGLNQMYDIEIDKVNKPYLPLASGEFSLDTGRTVVFISAALSLALGVMVGSPPLLWALAISQVLGTAYSVDVPFLRWKRSALAAAICILAVRAIVVQLGFYLHMQTHVFGRVASLTSPVLFATFFMCFFSVVIALAKDIPDVEGDKAYGIRSFSVRMGQSKIFWLCVWLLELAYGVSIVVGATSPVFVSKVAMIFGHAGLGIWLWSRSRAVDLQTKSSITSFYMFVWKLFYAEYFIIPFMR